MFKPMVLSASLACSQIGGFHDAGPAAGGDDEAMAFGGNGATPLGEQEGEPARVLVIAGHVHGNAGTLDSGLLFGSGESSRARLLQQIEGTFSRRETLLGLDAAVETSRAEENDGILNVLPAKAG